MKRRDVLEEILEKHDNLIYNGDNSKRLLELSESFLYHNCPLGCDFTCVDRKREHGQVLDDHNHLECEGCSHFEIHGFNGNYERYWFCTLHHVSKMNGRDMRDY